MTGYEGGAPAAAGGPGGGGTTVRPEGLRELGTGLEQLADTLGTALQAVDSVPLDVVGAVLGPVGAGFAEALLAATGRHRHVLSELTRVTGAAGELVLASERLYTGTDAGVAGAVGAAATPAGGAADVPGRV